MMADVLNEEQRAELYRRQAQARADAQFIRWKQLAGSPTAYRSLLEKTRPLMRDRGWDPVERLTESERDAVN